MYDYTFEMTAAVTVTAETEAEARAMLCTATLPEDISFRLCGVYFAPGQSETATLVDTYENPNA